MVHTACPVCFITTVNGCSKIKIKKSLGRLALVAGTQQTLSYLFWRFLISMSYAQIIFSSWQSEPGGCYNG
jgi:hypothetical protein